MPSSILTMAAKAATPSHSVARRALDRVPEIPRNVGPTEQLISLGAGAALTAFGLTGRRINPLALLAGGLLIHRGISGSCAMKHALTSLLDRQGQGQGQGRGETTQSVIPARHGVRVECAVTINRPADELYRAWRNLSRLPDFMGHLEEVREHGLKQSHWVARGPLGMRVEWDAEIITDEPNRTIAWRSLPNADVDTAGSVHFTPTSGGATEVRVNLKYDPPAGKAGALAAKLLGESPEKQIEQDLTTFKQQMESRRLPTAPRPAAATTTGTVRPAL